MYISLVLVYSQLYNHNYLIAELFFFSGDSSTFNFIRNFILFHIVAVLFIYILINGSQRFTFLHILSNIIYLIFFIVVLVAQLCLTLCDPMDGSPPGSSVHGIFQARILEWVAISFSNNSLAFS